MSPEDFSNLSSYAIIDKQTINYVVNGVKFIIGFFGTTVAAIVLYFTGAFGLIIRIMSPILSFAAKHSMWIQKAIEWIHTKRGIKAATGILTKSYGLNVSTESKILLAQIVKKIGIENPRQAIKVFRDYYPKKTDRLAHKQIQHCNTIQISLDTIKLLAGEKFEQPNLANSKFMNTLDAIKNVSELDMQDIWARLIAGEIKQPGKYSLQTIKELSTMTSEDFYELVWFFDKFYEHDGKIIYPVIKVEEVEKVVVMTFVCTNKYLGTRIDLLMASNFNISYGRKTKLNEHRDACYVVPLGRELYYLIKELGSEKIDEMIKKAEAKLNDNSNLNSAITKVE